jgi:hypothetical protein
MSTEIPGIAKWYNPTRSTDGTGFVNENLSIMELMDIYNAIKNPLRAQNYFIKYGDIAVPGQNNLDVFLDLSDEGKNKLLETGKATVDKLLDNLSPEHKEIAEAMFKYIQPFRDKLNKIYNDIFFTDIGRVENYWPSTSERSEDFDMFETQFQITATGLNPSFSKHRRKLTTPMPQNAMQKFKKHISNTEFLLNEAQQYKLNMDLFANEDIKNLIIEKYGKDFYEAKIRQLQNSGLGVIGRQQDVSDKIFNRFFKNWVGANLFLNPKIWFKQAVSGLNFAINAPNQLSFYKEVLYSITHLKEAWDYMGKMDFVKERQAGGLNDDMRRLMEQNEYNQLHQKLSKAGIIKDNIFNIFSSILQHGDTTAVRIFGYAQIRSNINAGMSEEEAIKVFQRSTLQTQQSSLKSDLGYKQQEPNAIYQIFKVYKNAQIQYVRNITNSIINAQKEGVSILNKETLANAIYLYAINQATIKMIDWAYQALKGLFKDPEDEEKRKEKAEEYELETHDKLILDTLENSLYEVPIFSMALSDAYLSLRYNITDDKATRKKLFRKASIQIPFLSDVYDDILIKSFKKHKTLKDYIKMFNTTLKITTGINY